jgi:hypothetical protein
MGLDVFFMDKIGNLKQTWRLRETFIFQGMKNTRQGKDGPGDFF